MHNLRSQQLGRAEDAVAVLEEALALKEDPGIAEVRDQIAVSILTDKVRLLHEEPKPKTHERTWPSPADPLRAHTHTRTHTHSHPAAFMRRP